MKSRLLRFSPLLLLPVLAIATAGLLYLQAQGVAPRALAPYIEKRASGHNPAIVAVGGWSARTLLELDRGEGVHAAPAFLAGAGARPGDAAFKPGRAVTVMDEDSLRRALAQAEPGDMITIVPGTYRMHPQPLAASRPGLPDRPVTVRAVAPGTVTLEFQVEEGIKVSAPYWRFENLKLQGVCRIDTDCEHAFHIVGPASYFAAVNNTVVDFNAHFKINGEAGRFPDHGLIEANTISNTRPRQTANPVTPIDIVGASHWTIRANVISDFVKAGGDGISFGAFAKGGGSDNVFERNIVWCERLLQGQPGQRVGLSLGGGGTLPSLCRDGRCIVEQERATLRDNLVLGCSDAGIYLNSAAASKILRNSVFDTAGVQVRYPTSSADLQGNLIDGAIVARDGGLVRAVDNIDMPLAYAYLGYHPVRSMFRDFAHFDLAWKDGVAPRRAARDSEAGADLCGGPAHDRYGAFADFAGCVARP
jgi:parallel beta-helix repeat protein